jgi:hypothetical protein
MKKYISSIVFGCLGICLGFSLCYVRLVLPEQMAKLDAPKPLFPKLALRISPDGQTVLTVPGTQFMFKQVMPEAAKK